MNELEWDEQIHNCNNSGREQTEAQMTKTKFESEKEKKNRVTR